MSDIVQMSSTVEDYSSGQIYRVRSRNADQFELQSVAVVLDNQPEPATTIEGV